MKNKIFLSLFITTFLLSGYSTVKVVQPNPPLLIAQSIWKPFSSQEGGFTILMPGNPKEQNRTVTTKLGSIPIKTFSVIRQNEALYGVGYSDLPGNSSLNSSEINELLTGIASGFAEGSRGKIVSQQNIRLGNFQGREIRLRLERGVIAIGRMYLVNKRLYQVVVATNKERNLTKSIEGFFRSFRLVNNSTASQGPSPEELNADLKQAVCSQNWPEALKVIDQMIASEPSSEVQNQLTTYRSQVQGLANSGSRIPAQSLPECASVR